jgi:hypothetical protein
MRIFDEKSANEVKREEREYEAWQIKEKNRILSVSNQKRKQKMWNRLFPQVTHSDAYLSGKIF